MAGGATKGSLDRGEIAADAVDGIDAGWDEVPESASVLVRHPVSAIVLPGSVTLRASSVVGDVDEPTLEIGEAFADGVELDGVESDQTSEVHDDELFDVPRGVDAARVRILASPRRAFRR